MFMLFTASNVKAHIIEATKKMLSKISRTLIQNQLFTTVNNPEDVSKYIGDEYGDLLKSSDSKSPILLDFDNLPESGNNTDEEQMKYYNAHD